ncbi:FAD-binding oxidoreductase [Vitreoscilla massiliensis]|uniref:FAD-binding oxidoreductase n=1 Tax=Vitreoscilla massiliensis TaxID=1689272 RepID=A0ABY4E1T1_9NEIS|nr:FAD-dependent oxidoreductase [Vitreoscilla massiliensis]UOO89716.1 FAD-binding oxidoreductase [Vitreoscilla massiliensis]
MDALCKLPNQPYWFEETPSRPQLSADISADVAIVGAGYTGLWTAYYLLKQQPSLRVVIIEREHVGYGASGRNGGWASAIFPISLHKVAQNSSHQQALDLQYALNDTVDELARVLQAEHIDADYCKHGFLSVARSSAQLQRAQAAVAASTAFGLPKQWQFLNAQETQQRIGISRSLGGLYTPHCAVVHPGKLVRALAQTVEKMGAQIYEQTAATDIAAGQIRTHSGSISASTIVRATESYTCQQAAHQRQVIPLYSSVLATAPIAADVRERLGLHQRFAFNDMRHLRVYAQMTADGRMIFGGRGEPYHFGSKISPQYDLADAIHLKLRACINDFFPELSDVPITHRWGGALGVARDWCPSVGLDARSNIAWAGQYVGDGVATSNLAGRILRNLILKLDEPINSLPIVNHRSPLWEPEPLRWLGVNMGLSATALADSEERLTRRSSNIAAILAAITGAH